MALATFSDLQNSVAGWLNRTDLTSIIPDFIAMAEENHRRDLRLRNQIISTTLPTVANNRGIALPSDFLEFENVTVLASPEQQLSYATVEQLDVTYPNNGDTGQPSLYTIEASQILFGPTPDGIYSISMLYYAPFTALSVSNTTNWLLTNYPTVYLYASLMHACVYIKDKSGAAEYKSLYEISANSLQTEDDRAQHSGSTLRVRTV